MTISQQLENLSTKDVYSLMLFVLFKLKESSEYSTLSQLAYIVDKESLLKLCEYFGGLTISIPTIDELETIMNALLLYQKVDIEHKDFDKQLKLFDLKKDERAEVLKCYKTVCNVLRDYTFNSGR